MTSTAHRSPGLFVSLAGIAAIVLGCFLPAAEPTGITLIVRNNTLAQGGDGKYFLIGAVIAAVLLYRIWNGAGGAWGGLLGLGLLSLVAAAVEGNAIRTIDLNGQSHPAGSGTGIVVLGLGSIALAVGGVMLRKAAQATLPHPVSAPEVIPEGWYQHPDIADELQWWNGREWTGATKPKSQPGADGVRAGTYRASSRSRSS